MFYCYVWWRVPSCHKISYCKQVVVNHQPIGFIIIMIIKYGKWPLLSPSMFWWSAMWMIQMAVSCNWDQQDSKAGNGLDQHQTSVACIFAPLDLGTFQQVGPQDPQMVVVRIPLLAAMNSREICHFLLALDWFKGNISTENHGFFYPKNIWVNHKSSTIN